MTDEEREEQDGGGHMIPPSVHGDIDALKGGEGEPEQKMPACLRLCRRSPRHRCTLRETLNRLFALFEF